MYLRVVNSSIIVKVLIFTFRVKYYCCISITVALVLFSIFKENCMYLDFLENISYKHDDKELS